MSLEQILLTIVVLAFAGSFVGISVQLIRILGEFSGILRDLRPIIHNFTKISDRLVEEQKMLDSALKEFANISKKVGQMVTAFQANVINPLIGIFGFLKILQNLVSNIESKIPGSFKGE